MRSHRRTSAPVTETLVRRAVTALAATLVALNAGVAVARAMPRQPAACTGSVDEAATSRISLEAVPAAAGDLKRTVHVCIRTARGTVAGSFHLVIEYDSSAWEAVGFVPGNAGSEVANLTRLGRADIAGAAPGGFASGMLLRLVFVRTDGGHTSEGMELMKLRLLELNATDGSDLKAHSVVSGLAGLTVRRHSAVAPMPTTPSVEAPHIDRLEPARSAVSPGSPVQLMIYGSGFRSEGNVVLVGDAVIGELPSGDGHRLRLVLPETFPSVGEVPPRRLGPGVYDLRVRTGAGTSNRVQFELEIPR